MIEVMAFGKKSFGWVAFVVMGAAVVFLIYRVLDLAVTVDHQSQQIRRDQDAKREMVALLRVSFVGKTREEVERFVGQVGDGVLVKGDGERVEFGEVVFEFANGRCAKVFLMGEG